MKPWFVRIGMLLGLSMSGSVCGVEMGVTEVSVAAFGAVADDGRDDGLAVRRAVEACRKVARPCLVFPPGKYYFRGDRTRSMSHVDVNDFAEITIRGENTELVGCGTKTLLRFERCGKVTVTGLDVDWDPLPFTAGRVVAAEDGSFDVEVLGEHPLREDTPVQAVTVVDGETHLPIRTTARNHYQLTQKGYSKKAQIAGSNRLRIFVSPRAESLRSTDQQRVPAVGSFVVAWFRVRAGGAFRPFACGEVRFDNCRVFATAGMGFAFNACDSVSLHGCQVVPKDGRWLSSTVDATHCNMVRKKVEYEDCRFEGMGDDAINVHGMYSMVHERSGPRTIVLRGWKSIFDGPVSDDFSGPAQNSLRVGESLEFSTMENPLVAAFMSTITESIPVEVRGAMLKRITVDRDLPEFVQARSIVADTADIPQTVIRNCVFRGGRGIGVRLKTRNAVVENCTFEDVNGAGVWITCDAAVDHESISARDVTIRGNTFRRTSPAVSSSAGRTIVYPFVHENVTIENNRIEDCRGTALLIRSVVGGLIRNNTIERSAPEPIRVSLSRGVRVE